MDASSTNYRIHPPEKKKNKQIERNYLPTVEDVGCSYSIAAYRCSLLRCLWHGNEFKDLKAKLMRTTDPVMPAERRRQWEEDEGNKPGLISKQDEDGRPKAGTKLRHSVMKSNYGEGGVEKGEVEESDLNYIKVGEQSESTGKAIAKGRAILPTETILGTVALETDKADNSAGRDEAKTDTIACEIDKKTGVYSFVAFETGAKGIKGGN